MLDKNALNDGFRKKIMNESDDRRKGEVVHRPYNNSRFDRGMKHRDNFNRGYNNRFRGNNNRSFHERNRFMHQNREQ